MINFNWYKKEVEPYMKDYEIKYRFFEKGDFGALNQLEFNTKERGGEIDFWSTGWLRIHFVDYIKGEEQINIFLEPYQEEEQKNALKRLQLLL
jgi:hypothetical protein